MSNWKIKNGHKIELTGGREPITGTVNQEQYDKLLEISENFANEFDEVTEAGEVVVKEKAKNKNKKDNGNTEV